MTSKYAEVTACMLVLSVVVFFFLLILLLLCPVYLHWYTILMIFDQFSIHCSSFVVVVVVTSHQEALKELDCLPLEGSGWPTKM